MASFNQYYMADQEIKRIQPSIAIVTILLSCLGIILTLIFFIFNIKYRNFRLIKMSSPNINNIINFNCILLYLCPVFNSIKSLNVTNEYLANIMCQFNAWIIPLSSTAIYAAMLSKAWRIYKIFDTTPQVKKVVIKDIRLVLYIILFMLIDLIVLFIWQFLDQVKLKARYVYEFQSQPSQIFVPNTQLYRSSNSTNLKSTQDEYPLIKNLSHQTNQLKIVFECNSNLNEVWITILTMYKIILLMYGIYLAWIIRNINVPSMNDSKYLLLSTYTIIICGLGSMTLMQLLKDWPDVVQAFFSIGIVISTCTTQCLLFIPKIRLWFKRRNDDNFKISLSQIFLQTSSSCYFNDTENRNSNAKNGKVLSLEDELCELLHENSQLKNYLKEKEDVIKILQEKIRKAKANLSHLYQGSNSNKKPSQNDESALYFSASVDPNQTITNQNNIIFNPIDSGYEINSTASTASTTTETFRSNETSQKPSNLTLEQSILSPNTEKLRNDLDEVEELTTRVRDSISLDLSNTRRYSPLLHEYYRKQLELAKSIQCTYNLPCNTLFDAMTLMKKCLKDYSQIVHNPEYLAIDEINHSNSHNQYTYDDFLAKQNNHKDLNQKLSGSYPKFEPKEFSVYSTICNLKKAYFTNGSNTYDNPIKQTNIKPIIEVCTSNISTVSTQSTSATSSSSTSSSSLSNNSISKSVDQQNKDNKQTYV
ncbi:unnamed protein product [Brachionus calyciflorus]|uniref:G-protein coupled receptors family 3 profile domain-containing protein n=1 Tax=Brachionus calyciflorus TaxID=104777 RepID=A0A813M5V9_9BILA|nr:unnamed protein product [Brachionus calyciflorus]